ncbi:hypothetical protein BO70DRAFT_293088 [Aspergillus heteromorphus CBS 117.55]|uniref:Stress response RCI peptide n=1 Tax=Aspergillus heteromorphus CBS 117.55 TaxID=1448321 RepID=A0A317W331_9EURO|nr:uncharacterized protein BO70DRAFT_293088 [Aspergillus heteromorphus CBS 117.55]PWY79657.1 hypothetical protein BO70DRAFT_293088 [Aspergillus heteromorphus CBS 117.55]
MPGTLSMICLILVTLFIPPLGVFFLSGCSADLVINICLTLLGYLPGHVHAFYLEYVFFRNRRSGEPRYARGVYSDRIQHGGRHQRSDYGSIA